jgi:hypothetical protein
MSSVIRLQLFYSFACKNVFTVNTHVTHNNALKLNSLQLFSQAFRYQNKESPKKLKY